MEDKVGRWRHGAGNHVAITVVDKWLEVSFHSLDRWLWWWYLQNLHCIDGKKHEADLNLDQKRWGTKFEKKGIAYYPDDRRKEGHRILPIIGEVD
jgi:hypothetical protein